MNSDNALCLADFDRDLKGHLALCEEALALATLENEALNSPADYQPFAFYQRRKDLLPRLENSLMALRKWRENRERASLDCGELFPGAGALFDAVQAALMRVLLLDRDNQQALLRRGLLPAQHLPATSAQPPHCVADLYRRHNRG